MSYITVKDLSVGYDGHAVSSGISFQVEPGDYLCIVGENGSGKSTLMRTLLGLQECIAGEISFSDGLLRSEIGYLPQQTQIQKDFPASVREIVLSGFQGQKSGGKRSTDQHFFHSFYTRQEKQLASQNIERMGITHLTGRCYRELSGGQQQRVLLARALCATTKLLLLDEPVAGLDPGATQEMYTLVKRLNDEGISIIMISHDLQAALSYSDHILHIGEDIFFGTTDAFLRSRSARKFTFADLPDLSITEASRKEAADHAGTH